MTSSEAELVLGDPNSEAVAGKGVLLAADVQGFVRMARDGVLVYADGRDHEAGFFPEKLVGRSGRGDTCLAAYVARRLTATPAESTVWAAAATSLKMEAEGPFRRHVHEIEDLIRDRYGR